MYKAELNDKIMGTKETDIVKTKKNMQKNKHFKDFLKLHDAETNHTLK